MKRRAKAGGKTAPRHGWIALGWLPILVFIAACSGNKPYTVDLMPAPEVYAGSAVDPFDDIDSLHEYIPYQGMLYATDRQPSEKKDLFYENNRGFVLRLGLAGIAVENEDLDWEAARRVSLLKNRSGKYPLKVSGVEEFGILDRSVGELTDPALLPEDVGTPAAKFADLINLKLQTSRQKEILIYVHGYKVVFDNPVLLTTELWHFLGYEGVAIAFSWPSTPSTWAYMSDLETAALSAHSLRVLLHYLADETEAERINIIGYSAGTRVVIDALDQLSLITAGSQETGQPHEFPIGQVILVGSDYDRHLFGAALANGLLEVPDRLTIYLSEADKALGVSRWLFKRDRLGQMWKERPLKPHVSEYLQRNPSLVLIDVTDAESAATGHGHDYFRRSPWVSSDILISLLYDLEPEKRGLARVPDLPVWHFPEDYNRRLNALLNEFLPAE
jgi:esterase/lipase superfamily enzyme